MNAWQFKRFGLEIRWPRDRLVILLLVYYFVLAGITLLLEVPK
jgi:hypothetical protein